MVCDAMALAHSGGEATMRVSTYEEAICLKYYHARAKRISTCSLKLIETLQVISRYLFPHSRIIVDTFSIVEQHEAPRKVSLIAHNAINHAIILSI